MWNRQRAHNPTGFPAPFAPMVICCCICSGIYSLCLYVCVVYCNMFDGKQKSYFESWILNLASTIIHVCLKFDTGLPKLHCFIQLREHFVFTGYHTKVRTCVCRRTPELANSPLAPCFFHRWKSVQLKWIRRTHKGLDNHKGTFSSMQYCPVQ